MLSRSVPIYRDLEGTFDADMCLPLLEAVKRGEVTMKALARGHYPGDTFPAQALAGLKTVGFWNADKDQSWQLPWHRNEGIEITFLEAGSVHFDVDDRQFVIQSDDLTVTRPWQRHRIGDPTVTAGRLHWLILDVGVRRPNQEWKWPSWIVLSQPDLEELTYFLRHSEQFVMKTTQEVRRCFRNTAQAVKSNQSGSGISRLAVAINELLVLLLDLYRVHNVPINESLSGSRLTVHLFLEDLHLHPEHLSLEWSVRSMAAACGLGVTQFVHHARMLTNMTPLHYLNYCRLDRAAHLLRTSPATSITEIAMECGFSTSQYFATAFNKRFGSSPREFRRVPGVSRTSIDD